MRNLPQVTILSCALALVVTLAPSCSSDPAINTGGSTATVKGKKRDKKIVALDPVSGEAALYDRFAFDPRTLQRDDKGNFVGAVRSEYDGQKNVAFGGGVGKASYKTKSYSSPTWTGNKAAETSSFTGNTDGSRFQVPSRFQGTSVSQMSQRSRFEGTTAQTSTYRTSKASEQDAKRMEKPSDAWTDFRRKVYPQPPKMSKADYDKLTVEQTRSILGRED